MERTEEAAFMDANYTEKLNTRLKFLMSKDNNTYTFPILTFKNNCDHLKNLLIFFFKNTNEVQRSKLTDANNFNEQEFIEDMQEVYDIIVALKKDNDNYNGYIKIGFPEDFQHYINILRATEKGVNNNPGDNFNIGSALTFTDIIIRHKAINAFNIEEGDYSDEELGGGGKQMYGGAPTSQEKKIIRDELVKLIIIDKLPILIDIYYPHVGSKAPNNHYPDPKNAPNNYSYNYENFYNNIIPQWIEENQSKSLTKILEGYKPPENIMANQVSQSQTTPPASPATSVPSFSGTPISPGSGVQTIRQWPDKDYLWEIVLDIFDKVFTIIKNTELSGMNIAEQYIESLVAKTKDKETPLIPIVLTKQNVDINYKEDIYYEEFKQLLMAYIYSDNIEYVKQRLEPSTGTPASVVEDPEGFTDKGLESLIAEGLMPNSETLEEYKLPGTGDTRRYNPTILIGRLPFNQVMLYGNNHHIAKNQEWAQMIIMRECQSFISTIVILLRQLALEGILPWKANVIQIIRTRYPSRFFSNPNPKSKEPFAKKLYEYFGVSFGETGEHLLDTINRITSIVKGNKGDMIDFADYLDSIYKLNYLKYIKEEEYMAKKAEEVSGMDENSGGGVYELKGGMDESDSEKEESPSLKRKSEGKNNKSVKRVASPIPDSNVSSDIFFKILNKDESAAQFLEIFNNFETNVFQKMLTSTDALDTNTKLLNEVFPSTDSSEESELQRRVTLDKSSFPPFQSSSSSSSLPPFQSSSSSSSLPPFQPSSSSSSLFYSEPSPPFKSSSFSSSSSSSSSFSSSPSSSYLAPLLVTPSPVKSKGSPPTPSVGEYQGSMRRTESYEKMLSREQESKQASEEASEASKQTQMENDGGSKKKKTRRRKKKKKTKKRRSKNNTKTRSNRRKKRSKGKKRRNNRRT